MLGRRLSWGVVVLVCLVGAIASIGLSRLLAGYPVLVKPFGEQPPASHLNLALLAEGGRSLVVGVLALKYLRTRDEAAPGIDSLVYAFLFAVGTAWLIWMFWLIAGDGIAVGQAGKVAHVVLLVLGCLLASLVGRRHDGLPVGGRAWKEARDRHPDGMYY